MPERSKYQDKVIRNYYQNEQGILLQRLSDLVTNLYLAEGKARGRQWKQAATALAKLGVPESRIKHITEQDKPELLANLVSELWGQK